MLESIIEGITIYTSGTNQLSRLAQNKVTYIQKSASKMLPV